MTAVKGAVDILRRKGTGPDARYLTIIENNVAHLNRVVSDFLDHSKIEAGRLDLDIQEASLPDVVMEALESLAAMADGKDVRLAFPNVEDVFVPMDRYRIFQVVTNLVSNAVRYSPAREAVTVTIARGDGNATVSITDGGPGVEARYHRAIFRTYYQVPSGQEKNRRLRGTSGIGLAVCKGLVEAHGGRIRVESRPGAGSRFCFTLSLSSGHIPAGPMTPDAQEDSTARAPAGPEGKEGP